MTGKPTSTSYIQRRSRLRSTLAISLVIGTAVATTGCSSSLGARVASLNPFSASSKVPKVGSKQESSWFSGPEKLAEGAKQAASKSTQTFAGWFDKNESDEKPGVEKADATDPTSLAHDAQVTPEVFVANGRLWESTGNYEKAMENYAKALELSPEDPAALANIARLHFRQENHKQAAEYFGKAIKKKPDDAGLYNDLGLTLSKLGNHSAAATTIEQALRLSPGSSRYANNLASVKFESGDQTGALEVLAKNNKPAVAHFNMAYLHYKHGQAVDATRHLSQAIQYESHAENDVATERAVERSRQLLAQIGTIPGITPGAAVANNPASSTASQPTATVSPAGAKLSNSQFGTASFKQPTAPATSRPSTGVPSANVPSAGLPSAKAQPSTDSATTSPNTQPAGGKFSLPPGFELP